jgi:primosomal protein N' (replication factor Y)
MPQKETPYFAHITILQNTYPGAKSIYTYYASHKTSCGDLVRVPFGKKIVSGIVTKITKNAPRTFAYKSISETLYQNALTQKQLLFAQYLVDEYALSPVQSLRPFLPPEITRKSFPLTSLSFQNPSLSSQEKIAQQKLSKISHNTIFIHPIRENRLLTLIKSLQKKTRTKQILILFPDRASLSFFEEIFEKYAISLFHSSIPPSKKYAIWKHIHEGKPLLLAGTKSALFLPFQNLDCLVLEEEFRSAYKDIQSRPYYDIRRLAHQLTTIHQSPFVLSTSLLSFTRRYLAQKNKWEKITVTPRLCQPTIEDLRLHAYKRKSKKRPTSSGDIILTPVLLNSIKQSFSQSSPFLLLSPRRGMQGLSICKKCHAPLLCEHCNHALTLQKNQNYLCPYCKKTKDLFVQCPSCNTFEFQTFFPGSQALEKAIETHFPTKRILRVDADTYKKGEKALKERNEKILNSDIIIGTPHTLYTWPLPTPSGIGITEADVFWQWSDYLSEESAYFLFSYARFLASKQSHSPFIIQTFQEHHRILQALISEKKEYVFFQETLDERSLLHYPPFSRAILLSLKDTSRKNAPLAQKTYTLLQKTFPKSTLISEPYIPPQQRLQTTPSHILIRLKGKYDEKLPPKWKTLAQKLSPSWNIDIDPIHIF